MIVNRQRRIPVDLEPLAEFCRRVRDELHFPEDGVTVRLVSDPAIARLNRIFRGKNAPTDVLSFPSTARQVRAECAFRCTAGASTFIPSHWLPTRKPEAPFFCPASSDRKQFPRSRRKRFSRVIRNSDRSRYRRTGEGSHCCSNASSAPFDFATGVSRSDGA